MIQNNVMELLERRARRRQERRPPLRVVASEAGISYYTLNSFIHNRLNEYPRDTLTRLCDYLDCNIGDLLSYEEVLPPTAPNP